MKPLVGGCLAILAPLAVSACAPHARDISPAYISSVKYQDWSCDKLVKEKAFVDDALPRASADQDDAADNDALMVFLIGVPTSGGGIKGEVARLKGEQEALRQAIRDNGCATDTASQPNPYGVAAPDVSPTRPAAAEDSTRASTVPAEIY